MGMANAVAVTTPAAATTVTTITVLAAGASTKRDSAVLVCGKGELKVIMVISCLVLGLVIGLSGLIPDKLNSAIGKISFACLLVMLTALGAKLGATEGILQRLGHLGTQAAVLALAAVIGSLVLVLGLVRIAKPEQRSEDTKTAVSPARFAPSSEQAADKTEAPALTRQ